MLLNIKENYTEWQYLKVQEFLANIGGFFKGILFITNMANYFNSFTSVINQIAIIEGKHNEKVNKKIPFKNLCNIETPKVADVSAERVTNMVLVQQ